MNVNLTELALARAYNAATPFEGLTDAQMSLIMNRGRTLHKWFKSHKAAHYLISTAVIVFLFGADYLTLMWLPGVFVPKGAETDLLQLIGGAIVVGVLHSYLMYSMAVFSMHEGAAHKNVFPPEGPISRVLNFISNNMCRLAAAEPEFYTEHHMAHHAKFGTEDDGEFLNFVVPRRYWLTFFPLATVINFSDFIIHRPLTYTPSRIVSAFATFAYNFTFGWFVYQQAGLLFTFIAMVLVLPHAGFYLDRLRQFTEHNLMPLENKNGSRSFGVGFWGLLVGGGPWGSPCHWEHHLVASLPWYQQILLHRYLVGLLTPKQREQFLIEPVVGFPKLWWRLVREPNSFRRKMPASVAERAR